MKVAALELRLAHCSNDSITALNVYQNPKAPHLFSVAYTTLNEALNSSSNSSTATLHCRTYANPVSNSIPSIQPSSYAGNNPFHVAGQSTNPFDEDNEDDDNDGPSRDRAFSKSSQGSAGDLVDR